jgi:PadR family transcriptional regulator PadR
VPIARIITLELIFGNALEASRILFLGGELVPRELCPRHGKDHPCSCAMGNIYRFVEPVILLMLKEKGRSYGYDLAGDLGQYALTDAEIEGAALYRTLRRLEANGYVKSDWDTRGTGPARRVYLLTRDGERHLGEWAEVLDHLSKAMGRFARKVRDRNGRKTEPKPAKLRNAASPRKRAQRDGRVVA